MQHVASQRDLFLRRLAPTNDYPLMLEIENAEGHELIDTDGKKHIDLISGISVSSLGHNHPAVKKAILEQVDKHLHIMVYGEFVQSAQVKYAEALCEQLNSDKLNSVYFTNSGTEATEGAMKLAKRVTGRSKMISCFNAYHGSSQGALSVAGGEWLKSKFRPLLPNCEQIRYNCWHDIEQIDEDTACVIMEPLQAEAGTLVPHNGYLKMVRERCSKVGALLIFDEIQTAFGRTGALFAHQLEGVVPDIILLGKALGGGMPLGAFISSFEHMASFKNDPILGHITTFGGHPVSCAAGKASFDFIVENKLYERALELEKVFRESTKGIKVNGRGMLLSVELKDFNEVQEVVKYCIANGVITDWFLFNEHSVRVAPPLTIPKEALRKAGRIIKEGVEKCLA